MSKNTNIDGSQSISKDLVVGGTATVRSTAEFARNVKIKGWLEAPNIKHAYKGLYATGEALMAAYPKPEKGWYAIVAPIKDSDDATTNLEDVAKVYMVVDGEWYETSYTTAQLNDYVETVEEDLDQMREELNETLSEMEEEYVKFTDVAITDSETEDKTGVMSLDDAYALRRLHKAAAHISYFLSGQHSIIVGSPSDAVAAIYFLPDMQTFAASTVVQEESSPTLYKTWEANERSGFHGSDGYVNSETGLPLNKLYINGEYAYIWDSNQKKMLYMGDFSDYVTFTDYASSTEAGVVRVSIGNGLSINSGVLALTLATTAASGAMSYTDKVKLNTLTVDLATTTTSGYMSAEDKTLLNALCLGFPTFTGILEGTVSPLNEKLDDVYQVWWCVPLKKFVAQKSNGVYYSEWSECGLFLDSTYYTDLASVYNNMGVLYRYDAVSESLVKLADFSMYVSFENVATEETAGVMSAEDKKILNFLYDAVVKGRITNGTARFNNYCCSKNLNGTIDHETVATEWDGIMWLKDKKMFVAYNAKTVLDDCGCASVTFTFYTHWTTAFIYMEKVAKSEGLWKDKVYIYGGNVYVWKSCEEQLVCASSGDSIEAITDEELDEAMADFVFVDAGDIITDLDTDATSPLNLSIVRDGHKATIKGDVDLEAMTDGMVKTLWDNSEE